MGRIMKNGIGYTGGNGIGLVQSGNVVHTLTGQNLEVEIPITFPIPFKELPNVTVSLSDPSRGQSPNPQTGLGVMAVTKTGFTILLKSSSYAVAGNITIYWIATTSIAGEIDAGYHEYSTEEHIVGKWIDGSTIYEKTFTGLNVSIVNVNTWYDTDLSASGIDTFIGYGELIDINNQAYPVNVAFLSNNTKIGISCGMANRTGTILTIRYTKSS